jgi:hypothetical protein
MPAHRKYFTPEEEKEALRAAVTKYIRSRKGFLTRGYGRMKERTTNPEYHKAHLYFGKGLMSKEEFMRWAEQSKDSFNILFEAYEQSGFELRLAPSIDRIDPDKGYTLGNVRWVTQSENSKNRRSGWKWKKNRCVS